MSDALADVWAKSASPGESEGESLRQHTGALIGRLKGWRARLPELSSVVQRKDIWDLAAWACLLHDIGKSAPGFQRMVRDGTRFGHRHEVLSLVAVGWLDLEEDQLALVAAGVATHHRDWRRIWGDHRDPGSSEVRVLLTELTGTHEVAWRRWLNGDGVPRLEPAGFSPLPSRRDMKPLEALGRSLSAVDALSRRMRDEPSASTPLVRAVMAVRGLVHLADHAASAAEKLGAAPTLDSVEAFLATWHDGAMGDLFAHQNLCAQQQGNVLLRAPTGSGKTEAALLWAARQRERLGPRTIFYVLPYRASLNAMHARILERYRVPPTAAVLQHASATTALYHYLMERKEEEYGPAAAARVARHNRDLGRLMTAPVRVLTPYQLLKAFFGLRGHEAVLTDAVGGLFILDEPHAYDATRLGFILGALRYLVRDLGGLGLAMSATFPSFLRRLVADALGGSLREVTADAATWHAFRRHRLVLAERDLLDPKTTEVIASRCRGGEACLVVATTVARAQDLYDALRELLAPGIVSLLHSRFTAADRATKERELLTRVATGARVGDAGAVLVATQVVEVSLDVDFDVLFTDPAPMEALVQRFGRVNRGRRGGERDVIVHTSIPRASEHIYDEGLITRALAILSEHRDRSIAEDEIASWVDQAYATVDTHIEALIRQGMLAFERDVTGTNWPLDSHPELQDRFDELFDGLEVVPASFAEEYARLVLEDPLRAPSLRVPISLGQFHALRKRGLVRADRTIVDVPYSAERGLDLSTGR